uniref:Uncharacterized protein n=1 Tax=Graphocephala atropunctata TaxID=36148 RepID=A0A1B6L2V9_9HEMI
MGEPVTFRSLLDLERLPTLDYIEGLQNIGLLAKSSKCSKCGCGMYLGEKSEVSDGFVWRCNKTGCKTAKSLRKGTFFSQSNMPLSKILLLAYMWCRKFSHDHVQHELGVSSETIVNWYNYFRKVTISIMELKSEPIGGQDMIVQIEESMFSKSKSKSGAKRSRQWILARYDRSD